MTDRMSRNRGFSLLEVLVALVVIAVGALGVAGLQANALKYSKNSELRALAVQGANDIFERMRANRAGARAGDYGALSSLSSTGVCDRANSPTAEIAAIKNLIACSMPSSSVQVTVVPGALPGVPTTATVVIQWDESRLAGGASTESLTLNTLL
jgi:type IV pilus assembly protein PilV